jgi:hypothetical protein
VYRFGSPAEPLPNLAVWDLDRPEVVATATDSAGCYTLSGVPTSGDARFAVWKPGFTGAVQHAQASYVGNLRVTPAPFRVGGFTSLDFWGREWDMNLADLWIGAPEGTEVRLNRPGIVVDAVDGSMGTVLTRRDAGRAGSGLAATEANLDPGWIEVSVTPPAGSTCEAAGSGLVVHGAPNTLKVLLEAGFVSNVWFACSAL